MNSGDILVRLKPRAERKTLGGTRSSRPARQVRRGRARHRNRVRAAAAGHARRSRRQPESHRSQDLRRRPVHARATVGGARAEGREDSGASSTSSVSTRQSRGHVATSIRSPPAGSASRSRRCPRSSPMRGWVTSRRTCGSTTARSRVRVRYPGRRALRRQRDLRRRRSAAPTASSRRRRRWCTSCRAAARRSCCARTCARWRDQRAARGARPWQRRRRGRRACSPA